MYDTESVNIAGVDFEFDVGWKKHAESRPNDDNIVEMCFEHFFPLMKRYTELID